jgi:transcriptional regulator with XRE-family HTH domain
MSDIFRDYSFGGWLREFRREGKFTLRSVALQLNCDFGNLSKMERSEFPPPKSAKKIEEIAIAYRRKESAEFLKSIAFQHHLAVLKKEFGE